MSKVTISTSYQYAFRATGAGGSDGGYAALVMLYNNSGQELSVRITYNNSTQNEFLTSVPDGQSLPVTAMNNSGSAGSLIASIEVKAASASGYAYAVVLQTGN